MESMRRWIAVLILSLFVLTGLAGAEIYRWIDDEGVQRYTTQPESIPEPFRAKAERLLLPTSPPAPPELPAKEPTRVPITIAYAPGSPVFLKAKINGAGPITLILDTGADRTLIRTSVLQDLGISSEGAARAIIAGVTGKSDANAVWVNSLEIGEAIVGPLLIISHDADLKGADGLLGRDFLANFNVAIDPKKGTVILDPN